MKKRSFIEIIRLSWNQMNEILSNPFDLKKWIMLGTIAILAGQFMSFNFNINVNTRKGIETRQEGAVQTITARVDTQEKREAVVRVIKGLLAEKMFIALAVLMGALIIIVLLLWTRLGSNFVFVFIESTVLNDASMKVPYHRNNAIGRSYFFWSISLFFISLAVVVPLLGIPAYSFIKTGVFTAGAAKAAWSTFHALLIAGVVAAVFFLLLGMCVIDFVVVIMYSRRIGIGKAWGALLGLMKRNLFEFVKYLLMKVLLFIASIFIALGLLVVALIIMLVAGLIIGFIGGLVIFLTPIASRALMMKAVPLVIGICVALLSPFLLFIFLPLPVFFRLFSIYFIGSLDESTDPFFPHVEEEQEHEQEIVQGRMDDVTKYNRPIHLLWLAPLSSIALVLVFIGMVFVGGSVVAQMSPPSLESATSLGAFKANRQWTSKGTIPAQALNVNLVRVRLKNRRSIVAEMVSETGSTATFRIQEGTFTLRKDDIVSIDRKQ